MDVESSLGLQVVRVGRVFAETASIHPTLNFWMTSKVSKSSLLFVHSCGSRILYYAEGYLLFLFPKNQPVLTYTAIKRYIFAEPQMILLDFHLVPILRYSIYKAASFSECKIKDRDMITVAQNLTRRYLMSEFLKCIQFYCKRVFHRSPCDIGYYGRPV